MEELALRHCIQISADTEPLSESQISPLMAELDSAWELDERELERKFHFEDFAQTMAFVNQVAAIAEEEKHHPEIKIAYGKAKIKLSTHSIRGLTENDFILAAKIDRLSAPKA